jgi:hypothetical protein
MNHHVTMRLTPRRHIESMATPTWPSTQKSSATKYLLVLETFDSSSRRWACRHSTAPRPTWAPLWHASSKPIPHPRPKHPWLTFGSPRPWSSRHLCNQSNQPACNNLPHLGGGRSKQPRIALDEWREGRRPPRQYRQEQVKLRRTRLHRPTPSRV